jgi:hypothetical protein
MRKSFFTTLLSIGITVAASEVFAQFQNDPLNQVQIEVGDNYYGQSVEITGSRKIIDHFWANLSVETGSFSLKTDSHSNFLFYDNGTDTTYNLGLSIHDMDSFWISYCRNETGDFRFLNSLGVGVSYYDLTVHLTDQEGNNPDIYQGQKDISAFALYTDLHLLDYIPPRDQLVFSLGVKCNTSFLSSPQSVTTQDSAGYVRNASIASSDGGAIMFPYLEIFLGVGRYF